MPFGFCFGIEAIAVEGLLDAGTVGMLLQESEPTDIVGKPATPVNLDWRQETQVLGNDRGRRQKSSHTSCQQWMVNSGNPGAEKSIALCTECKRMTGLPTCVDGSLCENKVVLSDKYCYIDIRGL